MKAALLAAMLMVGAGAAGAGTLANTPATLSSGQLLDTYFIYPDHQSLAALEDPAHGVTSPWGQLGANSDLGAMMTWACNRRDTHNIKAVLSMGDMVQNANLTTQLNFVASISTIADACRLPFVATVGNHELGTGTGFPSTVNITTTALLYHQILGQDVMDAKGWFAGSRAERPDWFEVDGNGNSIYLETGFGYKSRSFWVPIPPLNIAVPEWEYGIRISTKSYSGVSSNALPWLKELQRTRFPHDYWLHVTHAGPCDSPENCDLTPANINVPTNFGGDWSSTLEGFGPNVIGFLNGHWSRGGERACWGSGGSSTSATRDDGSQWLAAGYDYNCGTRQDPQAAGINSCPDAGFGPPGACPGPDCIECEGNPYTWAAWLQLKRDTRQLCTRSVRFIDVDTNNDGTPNAGAGTLIEEYDRGLPPFSDPDPLAVNTNCGVDDDGPITSCPNDPERCIQIQELPFSS